MTTKRLLALLLVVVAATVTVARARRGANLEAATRTFDVTGVVTAPPEQGRVTVAHEAIRGYMPAMTMPFSVADAAPPLAAGDRVRFTLRVGEDWSRAETLVVTGHDPEVARAAAEASSLARGRVKKGDVLPAFSLTTDQGKTFTAADTRGRLTAITFIFTRCPVPEFCPLMVKRFQQLQREVERDRALQNVQLLSVTLDPAFDTPAVLDAYAKAMSADTKRWHFLTGDPADVERVTKAFSIHVERNGVLLDHTLATAIVDGNGRIAEIWRGNGWTMTELLEVLRRESAAPPDHAADRH